ncbi:kinesin-like protein KIN-12D isoform X2 [Durio zibethinus]|uniref:Kinesin-like protein KIN-12D isoform X2 n=1 Tax=Durio zibethinus TaxID=66656 RepID=A0A6P5XCA6_DURZI|nr:kinesin-like protein KIN-12D isoform X2 [Durio zibethinus]
MLRDFKFLRRNSSKNEEVENVPENPRDSLASQPSNDGLSRAPLNTIQDPMLNPKPEPEGSIRSRIDKTPTKPKAKLPDSTLPLKTPDKHGYLSKNRFGWAKNEAAESDLRFGGMTNMTPRVSRGIGRANSSSYSESNSTQSTPTKSVSKPLASGFRNKYDGNGGMRGGNFAALYKGVPSSSSCGPPTVVNTVEVPHFDLKEDPSFWMDHNVQVLIRVRPLNGMERSTNGYNRCLKQESSQSIVWIGQPETRFTFDHVACETVDQEMLFRMAGLPMVENCLSGYNSCMFAYGQTGSGKTYTMLGEIEDLELKPSPQRGMTPRIFEFLFARIQAEEEIRRDEKLKYNCKCSFLEIYNEQITDLLDPSATNLLLREDVKKGVYVENLSEFEVQTVNDILKLLTQGSLNRKVAATNMNRESSRSHSVFTCVIESRWEKDSTTNLRFARLNLVDLAGSERQKTSGAEGERLKEAASINKSLSTLGHVIMILVDVAHGKPRHIPYRDSKLTFLLQDSLGGNSKTMIIANVSPSICCATETLNTLKFAQRAKLIQNNAVVNEDSTGDVIALQNQIRLLKEELSSLKRQNVSRSLSFGPTISGTMQLEENPSDDSTNEMGQEQVDVLGYESKGIVRMSSKQLKSLETTLAGALRREQMAETSIKKLEAEIEQLNRLVHQREEDTRSTKMMLRFREDKIQRMESLVRGLLPADSFLFEQNKALSEEIQLLQARVDKNPEVTRFALENIRLLDQLRRFQEFYEEGEKEILLEEISELRRQLLQFLDGKSKQHSYPSSNDQLQEAVRMSKENNSLQLELKSTLNELEECRHNLNSCLEDNAKLSREINYLHSMLNSFKSSACHQDGNVQTIKDPKEMNSIQAMTNAEQIMDLQLELDILKIILQEEKISHGEVEERAKCLTSDLEMAKEKLLLLSKQVEDTNGELEEAKSVIEALESQQFLSINEMDDLRKSNSHLVKLLSEQEVEIIALKKQLSTRAFRDHPPPVKFESEDSTLQLKLKRMHDSLDKAKKMNIWYHSDRAIQASNEKEMDEIRRQAEAETAEVIVCLQEELAILQQQVHDCHLKETEAQKGATVLETELKKLQEKVCMLTEDNKRLLGKLELKDGELRTLSEEWELLGSEIENILVDGHEELVDASNQLDLISCSFPQRRIWISEQVGRVVRILSEKELLIEELGRCLEDATDKRSELECMLKSLRGAALVINEAQQQECNEKEKEIVLLKTELNAKTSIMKKLEDKMKITEDDLRNASVCATVAFVLVNRLSEANLNHLNALKDKDMRLAELAEMTLSKDAILIHQATMIEEAEKHIHSLKNEVAKSEEACAELGQRRLEEEQRAASMKQKLEDMEENDILKTQEKLSELRTGVSTLRAHMGLYRDCDRIPERSVRERLYTSDEGIDERRSNIVTDDKDLHSVQDLETDCSFKVGEILHGSPCDEKCMESGKSCKNLCDREVAIILLKKEIELAMESLKEVQAEMGKICNEKEEIQLSEKQSKESLRCLAKHALALEETMSDFEKVLELKIGAVNHKIDTVEQTMQQIRTHWHQTKEFLELEVSDAKIIATQKAAEAFCILAKFEEAKDTITEADIMINGLMIANETMKLDINRQKQVEAMLVDERDALITEVQSLQSINVLKDQQLEDLEGQFGSSLTETRNLVAELEGLISEVQTTFSQNVMAVVSDCLCLKSLLYNSMKLARSSLEDVWSEIIMKDCAVSVLHLCHMGILLETLTGLNAENGLLQHGLSESNAVMADLREHNSKSRRELEICRVIQGKLLADIRHSFDRISKKEEETDELSVKLVTFEKKICDLQFQEEVMLQRSNYMGSQLTVLMKELDSSNTNFEACLLDQGQLLKDKEELLKSQAEISMVELWNKDFESLILASEMEQMVVCLADSRKELTDAYAVLDGLKKEIIFSKVDACLKEQLLVEWEIESSFLQKNVEEAQSELRNLRKENCLLLQDLEEKKSELESSVSWLGSSNMELHQLKEKTFSLETCITGLQTDLELKSMELKELEHSQSMIMEDLGLKSHDLQISVERVNTLREENALLSKKLRSLEKNKLEAYNKSSLNAAKCVDSVECIDMAGSRLFGILNKEGVTIADKMFHELLDNAEWISKFIEEFEYLEHRAKELESENVTLQAELSRKDKVLKGLLFDLSLLQESASNTKDQKDEIEEMVSSLEALEDELAVKSSELNEAVSHGQMLEVQLQEKLDMISSLQLDISDERESLKLLWSENQELKAHIEDALAEKSSLEEKLRERTKITESLEVELSEMSNALSQMNDTIESLTSNFNELAGERDQLHMKVLSLEEKLGKAQAEAKQSEAIAMEAQQMAESRKAYAEDKEAEVKLLERSVEELECTINVLENKVDIIKGEAELQRLQREELESELHAVLVQMQNVKNADADMKRCLDEKKKDLQQALDHIQILETDISNKDKEIAQCKTHISELNLHAEAQANEYKQKFKALEAMAEQVKPEGYFTHAQSHSANKLEKNVAKPRGSGSPFKCIGLGLAQQIKSEKDEDLTAARLRIEELETLAANRQKEIFGLNARLAAAESMTHDVIRDLLGVKLDMTNYVSLLDDQQVEKIAEKARLDCLESQVKEHEVVKLKQQLNEFVEERRGWLEEIDRKQAELVAAQIALEKLRQRDQLLKTENEMLKMENVNYKRKVMELEGEVKKLSGQQNLQQRIHHHAKIKEENNMLKIQNEDLGAKLRRTELVLSRVREELAHYRASIGKNPHINFDEEQRLNNKLRESDDDRMQLAQKLLGLCTSILKAAGIRKPVSDICPAAAEEALEQLQHKVISLERELQSLTLKNRITSERNRLSDLVPPTSPVSTRTENSHPPKRVSQAPFLSTLDR